MRHPGILERAYKLEEVASKSRLHHIPAKGLLGKSVSISEL